MRHRPELLTHANTCNKMLELTEEFPERFPEAEDNIKIASVSMENWNRE